MKYKKLLQTIGDTPMIELNRYSPNSKIKILAKLEGNNPGGSIKDRIAFYMIRDAENKGLLKSNTIIIEPTSGNTGIGLAMISALKKYKFTAIMPESVSIERRKVIQKYGADIILTEGIKGTNFSIKFAQNLISRNSKYLMIDQFNNRANVMAHYQTTGVEIINQVPEITHFVAGMGTGGTLMGVGKRLKEFNKNIEIIGVEPLPGSKIQGLRNMTTYTPDIYDEKKLDSKLNIKDENAFEMMDDLFKKEGLSVGISSGAALWGAIKIAERIKQGVIVTIFPDRGDRYLSLL